MKILAKFMHKLSEMLSGEDGYWSCMRYVTAITTTSIIGIWSIMSLIKWEIQTIPESVIAIFAIAVTGKYVQNITETKENIAKENIAGLNPTQ